jgi:hypothetical protein
MTTTTITRGSEWSDENLKSSWGEIDSAYDNKAVERKLSDMVTKRFAELAPDSVSWILYTSEVIGDVTEDYSDIDLDVLRQQAHDEIYQQWTNGDINIEDCLIIKNYEAKIVGETTGGMTVLQIYINDFLFWSHNYLDNGATDQYYRDAMRQAFDDALACADVETWAEFEYDENGEKVVIDYSYTSTTWEIASYNPATGWLFNDPKSDGQAYDFISNNKDRIPEEILKKWADYMGFEQ